MSSRRAIGCLTLSTLVLAAPVFAQPGPLAGDTTADNVPDANFTQTGEINANGVYVRSGPNESDYPTLKLDRGTRVAVVGMKYDWLKIKPPTGSFCCVAKAFVDRRGDGKVGRVNNSLYVRVGSNINELRNKVALRLEPGTDVNITGEEDEYFKIEPPEGVSLFINKRFVDPVTGGGDVTPPKPDDHTRQPPTPDDPQKPATDPSGGGSSSERPNPTTVPTVNSEAAAQFVKLRVLEDRRAQLEQQPLDQQPMEEMIAAYAALSDEKASPDSVKQMCELRTKELHARLEARAELAALRERDRAAEEKRKADEAESKELIEKQAASAITRYAAVGVLRASALQYGGQTLYRVTDPTTGRTVVYLRTSEATAEQMLGQFVGVRGEVTDDTRMMVKYVTPTAIDKIDPSLINSRITADYLPPSLAAGARTPA